MDWPWSGSHYRDVTPMTGLGQLNLTLNNESVKTGGFPAQVKLFDGVGSIAHMLFGFLAGSDVVTPKESVMMLAAFIGYQVSQAQSGEPWSRTGGEFLEFALGMLAAQ